MHEELWRVKTVVAITGRSRRQIYADATFPKPIKLGPRASAWVASEVQQWIRDRIADRDAGVKPPAREQKQRMDANRTAVALRTGSKMRVVTDEATGAKRQKFVRKARVIPPRVQT